jgi:cytochrome c
MRAPKPPPARWLVMLHTSCTLWLIAAAPCGYAATALAQNDVARGKAIYEAKCSACHSVQENRVGPKHAGVFGRKAGGVKDYEYSEALSQSRIIWTQNTLAQWLSDPENLIPGQKMGYRLGVTQERSDVIRYLSTLKPKR